VPGAGFPTGSSIKHIGGRVSVGTRPFFSDAGETACGGPAGPPSGSPAVRSARRPVRPPSGPPAVRVAAAGRTAAGRLPRPIGPGGGRGGEKNSRFYTGTTSSSFLSTGEKKTCERSDKTGFI
jgi:hypothetical protein